MMLTSDDRVISAIDDSLWPFYDDFRTHKLLGPWKIPDNIKSEITRWILFLYSNEEYLWPKFAYPGVRPLRHGLISKLFKGPQREQKFMQAGAYKVWPFVNKDSFEYAKQNPILLAGLS